MLDNYLVLPNRRSEGAYRPMTIDEGRKLITGAKVYFIGENYQVIEAAVEGRTQTWVRDPEKIVVTVRQLNISQEKYFRISSLPDDGIMNGLIVPLPLN